MEEKSPPFNFPTKLHKYINYANKFDSELANNLKDNGFMTRAAKGTGFWYFTLLPTIMLLFSMLYKVTTVYCLIAFISLATFVYCMLLTIIAPISCSVLKYPNAGGYVVSSLISSLFIYVVLDKGLLFSLASSHITVYTFTQLLSIFLTNCPNTFTLGEALVVSQGIALGTAAIVIKSTGSIDTLDEADFNSFIISTILSTVGLIVIAMKHLQDNYCDVDLNMSLAIIGSGAALAVGVLHYKLGFTFSSTFVSNMILNKVRLLLICFWLALIAVSISLLFVRTRSGKKADTVARKAFHVLASLVFLSGILFDTELMRLAAGFGLASLIFVETIRKLQIQPLSKPLEAAFRIYCDEKDCGTFAMTPIYLYTGLSSGLVLSPDDCRLEMLSGVLAVGIGDSVASWAGKKFGYYKWPGSNKTKEGTFFNILSQVSIVYILQLYAMAPKKDYTPDQMAKAIEAVKKGEKIATAALMFGVPRVTLYNKISGKSPIECSMGPNTCLSKEEELILERWILNMNEMHIPITKEELLDSVQRIITDKRQNTPFKDNRPGKKWYSLFLKRHPSISERTAQNLTTARDNVTEEGINKWFEEIEAYLREKDLMAVTNEPERIFNTDESAFYLSPKAGKVLARRGDKHIYQSSGDEKDNLTVLITGNAAGEMAPPMIVFSYERIPSVITSQYPPDWGIGRSPSGWMCGATFYEFMTNIFNPWLIRQNIQKPVLFFLDGHRSHLTLHLSNFCSANGIEIIALYPNSTHILQPMDLAVFRPLKTYWKRAVNNWKLEHLGQNLKKEHFAPVLKTALKSVTKDSIKHGFRAGGLHPFGPSYVDFSKIKSSQKSQVDTTAQTLFLRSLEKEIIAKFRCEKLQLFKELFNKSRDEVEACLPEEDVSLYVIWASNKQADYISNTESLASTSTAPDILEDSIRNEAPPSVTPCKTASFTDNAQNDTEIPNFPATDSSRIETSTITNLGVISTPVSPSSTPTVTELPYYMPRNEAPSKIIRCSIAYTTKNSQNDTETSNLPATDTTPIKETGVNQPTTSTANVIPQDNQRNEAPSTVTRCSVAQSDTETLNFPATNKTPLKETSAFRNLNAINTNSSLISDLVIPSPFKRNLFWPGRDENAEKKKRRLKEKIPFAITGASWRTYNEEKEKKKEEAQREKERRAKAREEKRLLKEEVKKGRTRKRKTSKPKQIHPINDTSSDETESEIQFAESNDSYSEEENECTEKQNKKIKGSVRIVSENLISEYSSSSELDNIPLSKISQCPSKSYSEGNYIVVKYEGEYFPGIIVDIKGNSYEISTMTFSVGNTFKWPEKPDKIWYNEEDIVEKINEPVLTNKRGFYSITEMQKYLPFTI